MAKHNHTPTDKNNEYSQLLLNKASQLFSIYVSELRQVIIGRHLRTAKPKYPLQLLGSVLVKESMSTHVTKPHAAIKGK